MCYSNLKFASVYGFYFNPRNLRIIQDQTVDSGIDEWGWF